MKSLGERIKTLRKEKKISQQKLAELIKSSKTVVSMIENNKCNPTIEILTALSNFFNVSTDYIVKGEEEKKISQTEQEIIKTIRKYETLKETILNFIEVEKKTIQQINNLIAA